MAASEQTLDESNLLGDTLCGHVTFFLNFDLILAPAVLFCYLLLSDVEEQEILFISPAFTLHLENYLSYDPPNAALDFPV